MTIPFGRRRLVISLVTATPKAPATYPAAAYPAAAGATDLELARLSRGADPTLAREMWELQAALYGGGRR